MKKRIPAFFTGVLIFLLFPYVITILFNGLDAGLMDRPVDVEAFLPGIVSKQITSDYELETIKCQAVIARSNLYRKLRAEKEISGVLDVLQENSGFSYNDGSWITRVLPDEIYEKAVKDTKGQVLLYEGELKLVPYHEISNGQTRSGTEVLHDETYSYLKSVDSSADKKSPDYLNSTYILQEQMPENLKISERDSTGYVTSLLADGHILEGEAFRQGMQLSSSSFTIQKVGKKYRFLCKGRGHGLGFSQYGGNEMAKEGNTWKEILEAYFPAMECGYMSS